MWQSSLFSISPEIRKRGRKLVVRSSLRSRVLSLGLSDRTVVIDPDRRQITVRDRRYWLGRSRERYPFDLITAVSYHFLRGLNHDGSVFTSDRVEAYAVGLKLYGQADSDVHLFWFAGEGRFTNTGPLPDWVYWLDAVTDVSGTHEEDSRRFVTALGWVLNKPVVPK